MVGHSMGGLFSRAAYRVLRDRQSPLRYRSLTTIGTPWQGAFFGDYANGELTLDAAGDSAFTRAVMVEGKKYRDAESEGAGEQVTRRYLMGADGWNARQAGVLDDVPVTLIVGDYFTDSAGGIVNVGMVATGTEACTCMPASTKPVCATGAKSFSVLYGTFAMCGRMVRHGGLVMTRWPIEGQWKVYPPLEAENFPAGKEMIAKFPALSAYVAKLTERPSYKNTAPPPRK